MSVNLTFQDGTAILTIENPPLNLISAEVRAGLLRAGPCAVFPLLFMSPPE